MTTDPDPADRARPAAGPQHRTPPKLPRPAPAPLTDSPAVARLTKELATAPRPSELLADFWQHTASRTPLIESGGHPGEYIVTFLWRDPAAEEVLLFVNRLTDERNLADSLMHRIPGTDVWKLAYRMADDWRASYSFLPHYPGARRPWTGEDDQVALRASLDRGRPDPGNPATSRNRAGAVQSVVALPGAAPQPWLAPRAGIAPGTVEETTGPAGQRVWLYRPAGAATGVLPLLVVFDGDVWTSTQDLPTTLDNLIADGEIPPLAAVMVDSGDRANRWASLDLAGGADVVIAETVLPWVRARLPVTTDPRRVIACGQSLGALSALLTGTRRPDAVGAVLAQSASLWQAGALAALTSDPPPGLRAYLEVGRQEWILLGPNRELASRLDAAGGDVALVEYNGGHDYACWRGGIADGLRWITRDWLSPFA